MRLLRQAARLTHMRLRNELTVFLFAVNEAQRRRVVLAERFGNELAAAPATNKTSDSIQPRNSPALNGTRQTSRKSSPKLRRASSGAIKLRVPVTMTLCSHIRDSRHDTSQTAAPALLG